MQKSYKIEPIAIAKTDYIQKFAIPRQSGLVENVGYIELLSPYSRDEVIEGLDEFSHIWLIFGFHKNIQGKTINKTLVSPPKYPKDKKVGIFASRSPHRPNGLGLSLVKLLEIELSASRILLKVEGLDLLDQTPIFDIKPYLPKFESKPEAKAYGVCPNSKNDKVFSVRFSKKSQDFLNEIEETSGIKAKNYLEKVISQSLSLDPRPKQEMQDFSKNYFATIANCQISFCFKKMQDLKNQEFEAEQKNHENKNQQDKFRYIEIISIAKI